MFNFIENKCEIFRAGATARIQINNKMYINNLLFKIKV